MGEENWTARIEFNELPVPSVARRVQEEKEVAEGVAAIFDEQRQTVLRALSRIMLFGVSPVVLFFIVRQLSLNAGGWILWGYAGCIAAIGVAAQLESLTLRLRAQVVTFALAIGGLLGVLQFGPLLEHTFSFVASVLFATLLLGARAAYSVVTLQVVGLVGIALLAWLAPSFVQPEVNPALGLWFRLTASAILGLYFFAFVFVKVKSGLKNSLGQQIRLRIREQRFVEEREKMVRSAGSVQRLESLGRLAGGIAHDFNNSLVVIQCGMGALEDDLPPAEREEIINEINDGVNRAAGTARQLLSFAKRNVEEIGVCDPKEVAERLVKESSRLFPANVSVRLKLPEKGAVPHVSLSEFAVEQVLLTLMSNSREALGDHAGEVTIELGTSDTTKGLELKVRDTGPGLSPGIRDQVWEPFFTTKGEEHMGLGLSTLWATVRRHGGELEFVSEEGEGTTVEMTFPPVAQEEKKPVPRRRESSTTRPVERAVLVLEDEPPIRTALRRVLKYSGLEVVETATVAEAREAMMGRRFALLVSDGVLPDGGVGMFIRDFREKQRAPVILCSGYLEEDLALEGISKGECSFLPKPFSPEELTDLVETLLNREESSD